MDGVHDHNAGVLALGRGEVLQQGQLDAAVVVVSEVVDPRVTDPVVQHLFECDAADDAGRSVVILSMKQGSGGGDNDDEFDT